MENVKAGLLPLYAGLYDQMDPQAKHGFDGYLSEIAAAFAARGVDVTVAPVGIYEADIKASVESFEQSGASSIFTVFLAYHPSLESAPALSATRLPVAFLDVTPAFAFGPDTDPALIMPCHGIHGVQDLACVLKREGKPYEVFAGHYLNSDAIKHAARFAKAAAMAQAMKSARVGLIGEPFYKMGDFAVGFGYMEETIGIKTVKLSKDDALKLSGAVTDMELAECRGAIRAAFEVAEEAESEFLDLAVQNAAVIKKWICEQQLNAFSFNFLDFRKDLGLNAIPFVAASLLMGDRVGYAGEGDVLTAALTAAAMRVHPYSTFTEMFCPDWQGGTVFMSHMGEINHKTAVKNKLFIKDVPYVPEVMGGKTPGVAAVNRAGKAALINLVPEENKYSLVVVPCEIEEPDMEDRFGDSVRGWLRPPYDLARFLENYSKCGGTHHSCLCYGADVETLQMFGKIMGWDTRVLDKE